MEIESQVLIRHEKIQLQGFQRRGAHFHLKEVFGYGQILCGNEGGGKAEPEAASGWIPFAISAMSCGRKYLQRAF